MRKGSIAGKGISCMKVCNVGKNDGKEDKKDGKGVYVGESSRSIYERAMEHVADREKKS
jgi:hypothetical protein